MRTVEQTEAGNILALLFKAAPKPDPETAGDRARAAIFAGLVAEGQATSDLKPSLGAEDPEATGNHAAKPLDEAGSDLPDAIRDLIQPQMPAAPVEVKGKEAALPLPRAVAPAVEPALPWQVAPVQTELAKDAPAPQTKAALMPEAERIAALTDAPSIVSPLPPRAEAPRRLTKAEEEKPAPAATQADDRPQNEGEASKPLPLADAALPEVPLPMAPQPSLPPQPIETAQAQVAEAATISHRAVAEPAQPVAMAAVVLAPATGQRGSGPEAIAPQSEPVGAESAAPVAPVRLPFRADFARDLPVAMQALAMQAMAAAKPAEKPAPVATQTMPDLQPLAAAPTAPASAAPAPVRALPAQMREDSPVVAVTVTTVARQPEDRPTQSSAAPLPIATDFAAALTAPADAPAPFDTPASDALPQSQPIALDQPDWEAKLVERLTTEFAYGGGRIELTLTPENLGRLEVTVDLHDGRADVTFVTETQKAADLITQSETRLSDLLAKSGLDLAGQGASPRQNGRDGQGGEPRALAQFRRDGDEGRPTPEPIGKSAEGRVNLMA